MSFIINSTIEYMYVTERGRLHIFLISIVTKRYLEGYEVD